MQFNLKANKYRQRLKTESTIFGSYISFIILGALLLSLPISSASHTYTNLLTCFFTATSAMCVTGLVVVDTATNWSFFGQTVILILIQLGGMSIILVSVSIAMFIGKKIGFSQRATLKDALSLEKVGGIIKFTKFILKGFLIFELLGAILLFPVFRKDFGMFKSIWLSFFHSVSAFCNAGFDLMGTREKFSSLDLYKSNLALNIIIMVLIVVGGIGFNVWRDIVKKKNNIRKYSLQTKIVLLTTFILITLPALYFYLFEFNFLQGTNKILASLFQSITTRTAGFNTMSFASMSEVGKAMSIMLMLIGGSPGSTAGGMKTTTFAVLIISTIAIFRQENEAHIFDRRIEIQTVKNAITIFMLYLCLFIAASFTICILENIPLLDSMFEVASAIGTVGLTLGHTPHLSDVSRIIIILMMFLGRVGGLTFIYAIVPKLDNTKGYISENITIG